MKFTALSIAAAATFLSIAPAQAVTITGGNAVVERANYDSYVNFSILDGTNPISANGKLTSWSIYAPANASGVSLLIYRAAGSGYTLAASSALETPTAGGGLQTFALAPNFSVHAGDLLGLYFQGAGSAEFDYTSGFMLYTDNNSGLANATNFVGGSGRTYSVSVTGSTVPEPASWGLLTIGFGALGMSMRSRRRSAAVNA